MARRLANTGDTQIQGALTAGGLTTAKLNETNTMFTSADTSLTTLNNYGDQTVNEAYSRIGTSVSYKSGLKSIQREPTNCDLINNAFGVIQTLGRQWIGAMEGALSTVTAKMAELAELVAQGVSAGLAKIQALAAEVTGHINTAIAQVAQIGQDIANGIAAELAHIQDMVSKCLNFSFANVLSEWAKDLCAGGVINNIGSDNLKSALK
ncbi:hypothetical protein pSal_SNUABM02_139 [Salmonella phage pSal-SNUABM-02]|nr:hypothetical protein pSal_SNUABM02_139 [Salmonella phage pSal-SNUABM-02]